MENDRLGTREPLLFLACHGSFEQRCLIFAAQVGIAGSTVVDDDVVLAGQVGVAGHLRLGKGVAQRAFGFEMKVLAYEPFPDHAFCSQWNVELVELADVSACARLIAAFALRLEQGTSFAR